MIRRGGAGLLLGLSLGALITVGLLDVSAAKPPLGPRGWAPGSLPWTPSSLLVTVMLALAYVAGGLGLLLRLRAPRELPGPALAVLALGCLLTMPFGSADHTNYAAYGRIALLGDDPWAFSPLDWRGGADPVAGGVQPPWQDTPSIYGPVATLAQLLAAWVGGDNLRQVVWVWQWLIVAAWLGTRVLLRRLLPQRRALVDVLWTANPLVVGTGVLGAHVDMLATPLIVAALLAARRVGWQAAVVAGLLGGLATGVKATAGVVLLALAIGYAVERRAAGVRLAGLAVGAVLALVPQQLWAGAHVYDQLERSQRSISLASPWRKVYEWFGGAMTDQDWRATIFGLAVAVCLALAWAGWRLVRHRVAAVGDVALLVTLVLSLAYAAGAPYSLPWYDQVVWALLPAVLAALPWPASAGAWRSLGRSGVRARSARPVTPERAGEAVSAAEAGHAERAGSVGVAGDAEPPGSVGATRRAGVGGAAGALPGSVLGALVVRGVILAVAYVPGRVIGMSADVEAATLWVRANIGPVGALLVWVALAVAALRVPRESKLDLPADRRG